MSGQSQPYGPQTPLVRAFLQRLASQPPVVWLAAARRYAALAASPAGRQADRALGAAIAASAREQARDALVGPVLQMAGRVAGAGLVDGGEGGEVERLAEPALAAALALVVADRLADEQIAILTAAFDAASPVSPVSPTTAAEAGDPAPPLAPGATDG